MSHPVCIIAVEVELYQVTGMIGLQVEQIFNNASRSGLLLFLPIFNLGELLSSAPAPKSPTVPLSPGTPW